MDVISRFLHYVSFDTQSDDTSDSVPSAEKEKALGSALAEELRQIGLQDAHMDNCGYVYAHLPASPGLKHLPALGLIQRDALPLMLQVFLPMLVRS